MNQKIPSRIAFAIIAVGFAFVGAVEWSALYAREHPARRVIDKAYCTFCHSDAAMMAKMRRKEGNTHFLFHDAATGHADSAYAGRWLAQNK